MRKFLILAVVGVCLAVTAHVAQAAIETGWKIDLSKAGQGLTGILTTTDVNQLTFTGDNHAHYVDFNGNGLFDVGDHYVTDGLFTATGVRDGGGTVTESSTGEKLGGITPTSFEITFAIRTSAAITGITGNDIAFQHLGGGTFDVYIDKYNPASGTSDGKANPSLTDPLGGSGFLGGTKVASFTDIYGTGNIHLVSNDGNDDTFFAVTSAVAGLLIAADGRDLLVPGVTTLSFSDSNYNLSPLGPPGAWPFALQGANNVPYDFFATEDGSITFSTIPEPASLIIWSVIGGASWLGMGVWRRRRGSPVGRQPWSPEARQAIHEIVARG